MADTKNAADVKAEPKTTVDVAEAQRQAERTRLEAKLKADDVQRSKAGDTVLVALTGFTIVDGPDGESREVKHGEEFIVSDFDLPRYLGRGRLKSLDAAADGVVISNR